MTDDPRDKTIAELRAQVESFTVRIHSCPPDARPDAAKVNALIAEAEDLRGALWEIGEKYGCACTNNAPRWQNGVYLRCIGDFCEDVEAAAARFLQSALNEELERQIARAQAAEAEVDRLRTIISRAQDAGAGAKRLYDIVMKAELS